MEEEVYRLTQQGFTYTEPSQWRVRLIPRGQAAFCAMPEVKVNFPYQYDCFILAHHAISDGITIATLIQGVLDILNDLLSDRPVNDAVQLGKFSKAEKIVQVKCKIREDLIRNPQRLEALIGTLPPPEKSLLLLEAFHRPADVTPRTRHVRRMLEPWLTDGFRAKSKTMGVTLNSSFVAVIHAAITELAREEGIVRDSYRLSSLNVVNLRRYMTSSRPLPLGGYTTSLSYSVDVGKDVRETFWQHCRKINQELQDHLKLGVALEQKVAVEMAEEAISPDDYYDNPPTVTHDFTVSNMGDMSLMTPGVGKHVQITSLQPLNTIHKYIHMNCHQIFTFRGRCPYTLSYVTDYMTQETANRLADKVVFLLEGLISK
ncbi:uncharacterized protein [Panulirus ornatus]|uniref:uncharacterized protein n=1 Tax=Panulirus ornatus TaxID=150431 RepID=UPI003A85DE38